MLVAWKVVQTAARTAASLEPTLAVWKAVTTAGQTADWKVAPKADLKAASKARK
jgi:hypothetical protein